MGKGGSLKGILKFALMSGMFSFLYKFTRYLFDRFEVMEGKHDTRVFISALISSFALFLLERRDIEILKVLIYPRFVDALYNLAVERGYIKPIPYGESLVSIFALLAIAYSYIYEPANISHSFAKQLDKYCDLAQGERELFNMERLLVADHIQMKYHGKPSFLKPLYTK